MNVNVHFYSYFKDLAGCNQSAFTVKPDSTLAQLLDQVYGRFPQLEPMRKSTLTAVGVDYQDRGYVLCENDEVSLFPPVQGG